MTSPPESRRSSRLTLGVALLLWIVLLAVGWNTWQRLQRASRADALCAAVEAGDWRGALEDGPTTVEALAGTEEGRTAAECLALAHFGAGEPGVGVGILERARAEALDAGDDWLPRPLLVLAMVEQRRRRGESAVELARAGSAVHPHDELLAVTELDLRLEVEEPSTVLADFRHRLDYFESPATLLRARLGLHYGERHEFEQARAVLGPEPAPSTPPEARREWYRTAMAVAGLAEDGDAVAELGQRWRANGGSGAEVLAWQALTVRLYGLRDPRFPMLPLLGAAADRLDELEDRSLARNLMTRLVGTLIGRELYDEALERLEQASAGDLELPYTPEDVRRAARGHRLAQEGAVEGAEGLVEGTLRFVRTRTAQAGEVLLLSPGPDAPVDSAYEALPFVDGVAEARRRPGPVPQRWVLRTADGALASGSVWPSAGPSAGQTVEIALDTPASSPPSPAPPTAADLDADSPWARAAGSEGVRPRRVLVLVLDAGDWRLVQYLRARGELPHLDHLVEHGRRAVLWSEPAFTAAAMSALAAPSAAPDPGIFSALHRLGSELGSNPFLGVNPVAALEWLVPERPSLFATVGAVDRVALNLLFAEGEVRAGRHGERIGPGGQTTLFTDWRSFRAPTTEDRRWFPSLFGPDADPARLETWGTWLDSSLAALDAFDRAVDDAEIDLVMTRIAAFDSATHNGYAQVARGGRDDGDHPIYDLYRYVDHRVGRVMARLDPLAGDVLIVMSDHGIESAMEHDPRTLFVAAGAGVPAGRVPGRPHLRGVPRLLAELLAVETDWPDTGLSGWGLSNSGEGR